LNVRLKHEKREKREGERLAGLTLTGKRDVTWSAMHWSGAAPTCTLPLCQPVLRRRSGYELPSPARQCTGSRGSPGRPPLRKCDL